MQREHGWHIWRGLALILGAFLIASPIALPLIELIKSPSAWKVWAEWDRMAETLSHTLVIAAGSSLLAIVIGGITAIVLARTTIKGRLLWAGLLSAGLFIPLPMLLSGWYLLAQNGGAPMPALWPMEWRITGTIIVHAFIGIPWAVLILSLGQLWIEPELEEEMSLHAPFTAVFRRIILTGCWPFLGMTVLLVSWPTWHEITVTDFFKVRTLAEEVYLQLNDGSMDEAPRAVAAILPWCLFFMLLTRCCMKCWQKQCPARWPSNMKQRRYKLGRLEPFVQLWLLLVLALLVIIPVAGLIARAGMDYSSSNGPTWSFHDVVNRVGKVITNQSEILLQSLSLAAMTGLTTAASALLLAWLARGSKRCESLTWSCAALLWALPGPILGLGLLSFIQLLIHWPGGTIWSSWLYSEPSPLPDIWVGCLRFLPLAWLVFWPIVRQLPVQWDEAAWIDGASPWQRLQILYLPRLWRPALIIALGIGLLSLGEISASKLVTTPGYLPLAHHLFQQMHAGADAEVAALSLTLVLPTLLCTGGLGLVLLTRSIFQNRKRTNIR